MPYMQWLRIQGLAYVYTAEQEEMDKVRKQAPNSGLLPFVILGYFVYIYLLLCGSHGSLPIFLPTLEPDDWTAVRSPACNISPGLYRF